MTLSGYKKCIRISIDSSDDGQLTNYQIKLTLVKGSGANSGSTIYLENENLNWPYDVRFSTDESGAALIDHWREEYDAIDGTWWVEVPTIPASGGTTIYLHVGDADASDASDYSGTMSSEDLSGYTATDANGRLTVSKIEAVVADFRRDDTVYLYKDFGAAHFNALDIHFIAEMKSTSDASSQFLPLCVSNNIEDQTGFASTDISVQFRQNSGVLKILLSRGAEIANDSISDLSLNTPYYLKLSRAASNNTVYLYIYSNFSETTLIDTLSVSGFIATTYRYLFAMNQREIATSAASYGYSRRIELSPTVVSDPPEISAAEWMTKKGVPVFWW